MESRLTNKLLHCITIVVLLSLYALPLSGAIVLQPETVDEKIILIPIQMDLLEPRGPIPVCQIQLLINAPGFGSVWLSPEPLRHEWATVGYELRCADGKPARFDHRGGCVGTIDCGVVWAYLQQPLVPKRVYRSTVRVYLRVER